jgi:hypothetical protein
VGHGCGAWPPVTWWICNKRISKASCSHTPKCAPACLACAARLALQAEVRFIASAYGGREDASLQTGRLYPGRVLAATGAGADLDEVSTRGGGGSTVCGLDDLYVDGPSEQLTKLSAGCVCCRVAAVMTEMTP